MGAALYAPGQEGMGVYINYSIFSRLLKLSDLKAMVLGFFC